MENDIDFMAYVDETTPPERVLKMLHAARRGYLDKIEQYALLSNQHVLLKIKLFGRSSEKIKNQPDLHVFDEAKATPQVLEEDVPIVPETSALDAALSDVAPPPSKEGKKKGRKPIPACYQRHDVIHDLPDHHKRCSCGCPLSKIGEDVSEQLDVIPAQIYVKRHRRFKYACKTCQETVKIAPAQRQAIPKTLGAPGLLAHVAVMKFDDHLPLYRQSEIWARLGVELSRATLSSWVLKMGIALEPLVRHLQNHLIQSGYIQADETVCQVLKIPGKSDATQSYMWVYMTGNSPKPAVVYEYQESRKGDFAQAFLCGFQGVLQSDGYSGYTCVKEQTGVTSQGCFAHARRKFQDVWKVAKKEGIASKALDVIGKLYDIESQIKDLTSEEKQHIRDAQAKPILEAFHGWLLETKLNVQAKGLLDKAIQYTLNQWDSLTYYVQNGQVAIDNNAAERQIRPFAIGRKNWLFMGSPDGAKAAAALYSIIETAKLNDVNPEGYLKFLMEHTLDVNDTELLETLMPWNANIENGYIKPSLKPKDAELEKDIPQETPIKNTS